MVAVQTRVRLNVIGSEQIFVRWNMGEAPS